MKAPRKNAGKKRRKSFRIAVRTFPLHLFDTNCDPPHDLGKILTPAKMAAKKVPRKASPTAIARATRKALNALVGCGPRQPVPHCYTSDIVQRGLVALRDYAIAGDLGAMHSLGFVLSQAVADLGEVARRYPKIVCEWSRKQNVVPVLTGRNIGHRKQLLADLDLFAVGEATPYRVNPPKGKKAPDILQHANYIAGQLCKHLEDHRIVYSMLRTPVPKWVHLASKLPSFTEDVCERWVNAAWACILDATDGHPEVSIALRPLGVKATRKAGLETPRTLAANCRAEIRQTLAEAFRTLASRSPQTYSE